MTVKKLRELLIAAQRAQGELADALIGCENPQAKNVQHDALLRAQVLQIVINATRNDYIGLKLLGQSEERRTT